MKLVDKDGVVYIYVEGTGEIVFPIRLLAHTIVVADGFEKIEKHAFHEGEKQ